MGAPVSPKPKNWFRRLERWWMSVVMGVMAFFLERAVLRSIRKGTTKPKQPEEEEPLFTTKGAEVDTDLDI